MLNLQTETVERTEAKAQDTAGANSGNLEKHKQHKRQPFKMSKATIPHPSECDAYVTSEAPDFHGMGSLLIHPRVFIMALHALSVVLLVLIL